MPDEKQKSEHIRCRTIIEILGKPREHVEATFNDYVSSIRKDPDLVVLEERYAEIKEQGSMWSKFVELDLVVKGLGKLIGFCFNYMPSSIEIVKPEEFRMLNYEMASFLNDLQGRLHNVDMVAKQLKMQNDFLRRNMNAMLHNAVMITLGVRNLDIEELSKVIGVGRQELEPFVEKLLGEKKIRKEDGILSIA
ncbi:hypothetical protein HYU10_03110 [Candidatus Woesearchaeota archaeon]|nr:hypothetical protein [Candidatus Woesearchaeota archaeon]